MKLAFRVSRFGTKFIGGGGKVSRRTTVSQDTLQRRRRRRRRRHARRPSRSFDRFSLIYFFSLSLERVERFDRDFAFFSWSSLSLLVHVAFSSLSIYIYIYIYIYKIRVSLLSRKTWIGSNWLSRRDILFIAIVFARWTRREWTTEISSEKDRARLFLPSRRISAFRRKDEFFVRPFNRRRLESPSPFDDENRKTPLTNREILQMQHRPLIRGRVHGEREIFENNRGSKRDWMLRMLKNFDGMQLASRKGI